MSAIFLGLNVLKRRLMAVKQSVDHTVYPKKYAHGFVVLFFVVVMQSFIMNSHEVFIHIHQSCFAGTGAIVRLPQCQWSKPDGYGKISQCITTTKHSKAKTVCIFLGIYCRAIEFRITAANPILFHLSLKTVFRVAPTLWRSIFIWPGCSAWQGWFSEPFAYLTKTIFRHRVPIHLCSRYILVYSVYMKCARNFVLHCFAVKLSMTTTLCETCVHTLQ